MTDEEIIESEGAGQSGEPAGSEGAGIVDDEDFLELEELEYFDRYDYHASDYLPSFFDIVTETDISVNIRKRAEWVDETDGDAKITLQYESNSGQIKTIPDMNILLIHDKSGSMDCNYGYNLEKVRHGWGDPDTEMDYPRLRDEAWTETIKYSDASNTNDIESEGEDDYKLRINSPNEYTSAKGADKGFNLSGSDELFYSFEIQHSSPCQADNHYYLMVKDDAVTTYKAWQMVSGAELADIKYTDFHHYIKLESLDAANEMLNKGYRVLRMVTGSYVDENGESVLVNSPVYFLDISKLCEFDGEWILNPCANAVCQTSDRLAKSQGFFDTIIDGILDINPDNKIAYVPFWGDVPIDGEWKNYKGTADNQDVTDITGSEDYISSYGDVSRVDFTSDPAKLYSQIDNSFTYNGTNWGSAFRNAIELLEKRSDADKKKKTLVLFLTDGLPHATHGNIEDIDNPVVNGDAEIAELMGIEGVAVWAVGVGVSNNDTTGLHERLAKFDSRNNPFYVKTAVQMDELTVDVLTKIEEAYRDRIYGTDGFYHDTLNSDYFILDESNLGTGWEVLESVGSSKVKGVPKEVYNLVTVFSSVKYVYVKSTKTVYWYIGELEDGSYDDDGHTFVFPVKFLKYDEHTGGEELKLPSNKSQELTYYTNKNPDKLQSVSMEVPQIIFRRNQTSLKITKTLSGTASSDQLYRYVCSSTKYTSGKVTDVDGRATITIPAGSVSGSVTLYDLEAAINTPTTYYVYEVDSGYNIVNTDIKQVSLMYQPLITTMGKSSTIPYSATASAEILKNENNYLYLGTVTETAAFGTGADLTVIKEIDSADDVILWEHGNPTFIVRVQGRGADGKQYTFYHTFEFTKSYVKANAQNGKVSMSYTFMDIPVSNSYTVEEVKASRYDLSDVSIELNGTQINSVSGGGVVQTRTEDEQFYPTCAIVSMRMNPNGMAVTFYNKKVNYKNYNHITSVKNVIEID